MPRRRAFGYILRRRLPVRAPDGTVRREFKPGYYVRFRKGGRDVVRYAGNDFDTAVVYVQRLSRAAERKELLGEFPRSEATFEAFATQDLKFAAQTMTRASFDSRRWMVEGLLIPFFRGKFLDEIDPPEVQRFLSTREGTSSGTRNRNLTGLSAVFRRAIDLGLVTTNPAREVGRAKETRFPLTIVPDHVVEKLLAQIKEPMQTFYLLLVESGLRLSEGMRLEWSDVDFDAGTLHVRMSKAKRLRIAAMTSRLRAVLFETYQRRTIDLQSPRRLFPDAEESEGRLRCGWRRAFKKAASLMGLPHLRIHALRHLYAVALVRRAVGLPTVQAVLGHSSLL